MGVRIHATPVIQLMGVIAVLTLFPSLTNGDNFRLWRGQSVDGLLQISRAGKWVIACSKWAAFSRSDANLLCRELRLPWGHSVITPYASYLVGNETFPEFDAVAIDFRCTQNSTTFSSCVNFTTIAKPSNETCHRGISVLCTSVAPQYRVDSVTGKLEVQMDNTWSAVCADHLTVQDAEVACKTLQRPWSDARPLRLINTDRQTSWKLRDLRCSGTEPSLEHCSSVVWGDSACESRRDVGLFCGEAVRNQFRLMNGSSLSAGRLEFRYKERWGTVCAPPGQFTRQTASVLCKSLNLQSSRARVVSAEQFSVGRGVIWMANVNCSGREANLMECDKAFTGNPISSHCTHFSDVAISCEGYRLDGSSEAGVLQLSYEGRWADVFSTSFDLNAATVGCRALNLPRSGAMFTSVNLSTTRNQIFDVGSCTGAEETFMDCKNPEWVDPVELISENITVGRVQLRCKPAGSNSLKFRHPGNNTMGLYEVYNGTHWGTICGNGLGQTEARIACKHLGLSSSFAAVIPPEYIDKGNGSVLMDGVACEGFENSFAQCDYNPLGVITCDEAHRDDLNIYCGRIEDNFEVRLIGGNKKAGRVEVKVYGEWGTVCASGFDRNAAEVVCRQLGIPISEPRTTGIFGAGEGRIWLHMVNCTGEEAAINDCKYGPLIGRRQCSHTDDIGVVCSGTVVSVSPGISGGEIAGIVIAVLVLLAILIVALCFGIRKWSSARRDIGSNLLKTAAPTPNSSLGQGGRVEYDHDNGAVNMGFSESPTMSRTKAANSNGYVTSKPYGGDQYDNLAHGRNVDYHDNDNIRPPAYHTLTLNEDPHEDKPMRNETRPSGYSNHGAPSSAGYSVNYGAPRSPRDPSSYRSPRDPSSYGAPRSPYDPSNHGAPRSPRDPPNHGAPRSPHDEDDDDEFGFGAQPQGRQVGRQGGSRPVTQQEGYAPGRAGYPSGNTPTSNYANLNNGPHYRPQTSPTRRPEDSPAYGQLDVPEGTSV